MLDMSIVSTRCFGSNRRSIASAIDRTFADVIEVECFEGSLGLQKHRPEISQPDGVRRHRAEIHLGKFLVRFGQPLRRLTDRSYVRTQNHERTMALHFRRDFLENLPVMWLPIADAQHQRLRPFELAR